MLMPIEAVATGSTVQPPVNPTVAVVYPSPVANTVMLETVVEAGFCGTKVLS